MFFKKNQHSDKDWEQRLVFELNLADQEGVGWSEDLGDLAHLSFTKNLGLWRILWNNVEHTFPDVSRIIPWSCEFHEFHISFS